MEMVRLLVAGNKEITRKGLCALVQEQTGWKVAAEARDGREAVERAKQIRPDVAIMDIDMPSLNGLEATRQIAKYASQTKVLLLSSRNTDQLLSQAMEAGANGYLLNSDTAGDLVSAVKAIRHGRSFFTLRVAREVVDGYLGTVKKTGQVRDKDPRRLTNRQREIVQLLAEGNTSRQVGHALNISVKTVETHRVNIMKRIDCHTVAHLVRYAIRNQIIEA